MAVLDPSNVQPRARWPPRCHACEACRRVKQAATRMMPRPYPPSSHITDADVKNWNQTLFDNPCQQWTKEVCDELAAEMLQLSPSIRPEAARAVDGRHFCRLKLKK